MLLLHCAQIHARIRMHQPFIPAIEHFIILSMNGKRATRNDHRPIQQENIIKYNIKDKLPIRINSSQRKSQPFIVPS